MHVPTRYVRICLRDFAIADSVHNKLSTSRPSARACLCREDVLCRNESCRFWQEAETASQWVESTFFYAFPSLHGLQRTNFLLWLHCLDVKACLEQTRQDFMFRKLRNFASKFLHDCCESVSTTAAISNVRQTREGLCAIGIDNYAAMLLLAHQERLCQRHDQQVNPCRRPSLAAPFLLRQLEETRDVTPGCWAQRCTAFAFSSQREAFGAQRYIEAAFGSSQRKPWPCEPSVLRGCCLSRLWG
mmetsp:Transcript_40432/g.72648  ORF Transcript_40432/g.72648 Transcript_40432/m.72648 type:complete len:244 (+) Transcript_40432:413-1144(+)